MRGWAPDKYADAEWLACCEGGAVMDTNSSVDLVVEADLLVGLVLVAAQLYAVHAQVAFHGAGAVDVLGVDLGEGDKCSTVHGPRMDLGELVNGGTAVHDRGSKPFLAWQGVKSCDGEVEVAEGIFEEGRGIGFEFHDLADAGEGVTEDESAAVDGAEEVADGGEGAAFDAFKEDGGPLAFVHSALDLSHFQVGVHFGLDTNEVSMPLKVFYTGF